MVAISSYLTWVLHHIRGIVDLGLNNSNTWYTVAMAQLQMLSRTQRLQGVWPCLKPRLWLTLFLAVTFFLLCPLWAYLSLCNLDNHQDAGQSCFLYSFVFNMPVSLPSAAILLVILASIGVITVYRQSPVFRTFLSCFLARAPPLS